MRCQRCDEHIDTSKEYVEVDVPGGSKRCWHFKCWVEAGGK